MISLIPYPIITDPCEPITVAQLLLVVGIGIAIGLIICFFIEHDISDDISDVIDWLKDKFRNKKEKN